SESLSKTRQITNKKTASTVETPVLLFKADRDDLVRPKGQNDFAKYAKNCTLEKVENSKHEVYFEKDSVQKPYLQKVFDFFKKHLFS
ncbi:MAG TPA: lysophospholipase, partial [Clostridium sp.]|nr:lysophospholipase [Clostridium sp.]